MATETTNNADNVNVEQQTKDRFSLAFNIITHLFPGHSQVFDWLVKLPTIHLGDIDRGLWVRVAVTYVVNYGTLEKEMMSLVHCAKINPYNSEVCKSFYRLLSYTFRNMQYEKMNGEINVVNFSIQQKIKYVKTNDDFP